MESFLFIFLFFIGIAVRYLEGQFVFPINKDCEWIEAEKDGIENLPSHKYVILEQCLYYFLRDEANRKAPTIGSTLQMTAPDPDDGKYLTITVHKTVLHKLIVDETMKRGIVNGFMAVTWKDKRLAWDKNRWKTNTLRLKNPRDIWIPNLTPTMSSQVHDLGFSQIQNIIIHSNGTVTANVELTVHSRCHVNFRNYPQDDHACCFYLYESINPNLIHFRLMSGFGETDSRYSSTAWAISDITSTVEIPGGSDNPRMRVCMQIARMSSTLKIELTLPMGICAVVILVSPMFGSMKKQLSAKLFAILLQFLCFQFLIKRTPQAGFGDDTPRIYTFYEWTLGVTLGSLLMTLIFQGMSQRLCQFPPGHQTTLMASAINKWLCCCVGRLDRGKEAETDTANQWMEVYMAGNAVLSLALTFVYLIGIIVICA